jgi:hypothetical protein
MRFSFYSRLVVAAVALAVSSATACRRGSASSTSPGYTAVPIGVTRAETLRTLPVLPAAPSEPTAPVESTAPRGITVTAIDADARSLLIAIAREAGISMVVSSDVRRRVSVSLTNASPDEAIAAIIAQAGLSTARRSPSAQPVVFYQLPMNVNLAPVEAIVVRYDVTSELAKWVVENRPPIKP